MATESPSRARLRRYGGGRSSVTLPRVHAVDPSDAGRALCGQRAHWGNTAQYGCFVPTAEPVDCGHCLRHLSGLKGEGAS